MEFGTTTGRPRRCGWLDIVALKYCCQINGFSSLNLTKLDVLTGLKEIKLGTSYYTDDGNSVQSFPADLSLLEQVKVRTGPVNPVLPSCFSSVTLCTYKIKAASGMALNLGLVLFLALLGTWVCVLWVCCRLVVLNAMICNCPVFNFWGGLVSLDNSSCGICWCRSNMRPCLDGRKTFPQYEITVISQKLLVATWRG